MQNQHIVATVLQRVVVHMNNADLPVMKRRQRTAFSPNYIHSLDSTHMMLTALACKQDGARCFYARHQFPLKQWSMRSGHASFCMKDLAEAKHWGICLF